jgi:hypothetical protein
LLIRGNNLCAGIPGRIQSKHASLRISRLRTALVGRDLLTNPELLLALLAPWSIGNFRYEHRRWADRAGGIQQLRRQN